MLNLQTVVKRLNELTRPPRAKDDNLVYALCFVLSTWAIARPDGAYGPLLKVAKYRHYSTETRLAALSALSRFKGESSLTGDVIRLTNDFSPEIRKAVFDIIEGRWVGLPTLEDIAKSISMSLIAIKCRLPKIIELMFWAENPKFTRAISGLPQQLRTLADEIDQMTAPRG
jgi:hypothetical protein